MSGGSVGPEFGEEVREAGGSALHSPREALGLPLGKQNQDVMNGDTLRRQVTITNPQGFHMRPAAAFAKQASAFQSTVTLCKDELCINGKSLLELFLLVAQPGTEVTLEVSGPDAAQALDTLAQLLAAPSVDEGADGSLSPELRPDPPPSPKG
jgi:phosphotransferase system HPr (HPr) family protein